MTAKFLSRWFAFAVFAAVACLGIAKSATALSCAPPSMSQEIFDASAAVFIGRVLQERMPSSDERKVLEDHGIRSFSGTMEELRVYTVEVLESWKGPGASSEVWVYRDTYWGDALTPETEFLFVTGRKIGNLFEAELCGNTLPLSHAGALLEELKKIAP